MIRRFALFYTLLSVSVLLVLTLLVLVRLNTARASNIEEATASYRRLQSEVRAALIAQEDPAELIRDYVQLVPTVEVVVLFSPERGIRFLWTTDASLLRLSSRDLEDVRGYPQYDRSEVAHYLIRDTLGEGDALAIDALYRVLRFSDAYLPLRDTLISLLVFAFLTVLVVIIAARPNEDARPAEAVRPTDEDEPAAGLDPDDADGHPAPPLEEVNLEEIATDPGEPGTLFNPVSGMSYREHLERKLGLELERAAYHDQDLACMLIGFSGPSTPEVHHDRASGILKTFTFEDLCFDFDEGCFCVVLTNTDLSQALRKAGDFKAKHGASAIGATSRNGRLVEASRVIKEAQRSLDHARSDASGIVGFRPDARKYRQFLTEQRDAG